MDQRDGKPCLNDFWIGRLDCRICGVRGGMLFSSIGLGNIDRRLLVVKDYAVPAGATIVECGADGEAVFTIRAGFVKRWLPSPDGGTRIVRLLKRGDVLGLECMTQLQYSLSAGAVSEAQLCRIPIGVIREIEKRDPNLYAELEARWHGMLSRTDQFNASVMFGSARLRVLKLLLWLADFARPEACPRLSRLDMAAMLDVSSETASRVIADLKSRGLLQETPEYLLFEEAAIASLIEKSSKSVNCVTELARVVERD